MDQFERLLSVDDETSIMKASKFDPNECSHQPKHLPTNELRHKKQYYHPFSTTSRCSSKQTPTKILGISLIILIGAYINNVCCDIVASNLNQPTTHETIVKPKVLIRNSNDNQTKLVPLSAQIGCPENLVVYFDAFDDSFVIDLVKNKRLISDRYFEITRNGFDNHGYPIESDHHSANMSDSSNFYLTHSFLNLNNIKTNDEHCHYHGIVNDNLKSLSAISIINHEALHGFFTDEFHSYQMDSKPLNPSETILTQFNAPKSLVGRRQYYPPSRQRVRRGIKYRRSSDSDDNNKVEHGPYLSNSSSLYVELLVVHDHSQYTDYNRNKSAIAERTMQIVNIMNAFYRQLNIFVALVGVVLWTEKDEIKLTEDGDATLNNFLKYRYEKLLPKFHHDNAQLITSTSFNGSVVGKALKGPICTHEHSGGVNTAHSHSSAIVAVTLAHELGHNLGMEHDEDNCTCPDEKCIMSSSSSVVHPKYWSSCSIDHLEDSKKHGLLDCLLNEPEKVFGPICGNGFVEEGEDCDIGEPIPSYGTSKSRKSTSKSYSRLTNPCCDRQTCKFIGNATCAQGPCCDLNNCSVLNSTITKVCRPRKNECDFEELCDGVSEYCPPDVHYHDGVECGPTLLVNDDMPIAGSLKFNRSRAYCHNGKCASHESQCKLLWGETGTTSRDLCYDQNVHGSTNGNCGYQRKEKTYLSCLPEDAICGMLHCEHNQNISDTRKTGKLESGFESASLLTVSFFSMQDHSKIYCHGAIIDAGPNVLNPGLVPNGAACGDDRMCLDQKCVPVYEVLAKDWCPSDCNGNGICDNLGICHCNDGTIGSSCYQFFGANFHLSLLLYMIMFFVPMVALIVLTINHYRRQIKIWWFLHNRRLELRNKRRLEAQQRRLAYDANGHKISISEPIPLSHQGNINRPFYKPPLDPWAEPGCELTKSPGYRLAPLNSNHNKQGPSVLANQLLADESLTSNNSTGHMKPVRTAPPPPVPSHGQSERQV